MALWHTNRDGERAETPTGNDWQPGSIFETPTAASRTVENDKEGAGLVVEGTIDPR